MLLQDSLIKVTWITPNLEAESYSKTLVAYNNNNNNYYHYYLQLGCHPVTVVILLVYKT